MKSKEVGLKYGFRSGLEAKVEEQLSKAKVDFGYETVKIKYVKPETNHNYTPDFILRSLTGDKVIYVETKGRFVLEDRKKHELIREQYPELDIRFVFTNSKGKIRKGSKTTYGQWCEKKGFQYADKLIPEEWLIELEERVI